MSSFRPACTFIVIVILLAACADTAAGPDRSDLPSTGTTGDSAFPVSIAHKFGSTEIPSEPQRVLTLGFQEHDAIFALGVEPIAVRYWFGDESDVIFPWADDEAGDAQPEILNMPHGELNLERIAALDPDLILGIYSGITDEEYERLSQIAPTITQTDEYVDFGVPWQDMTLTVGRALGREDRATELVAEVEAQFAEVREAHAEFEGFSVVVATYAPTEIGFFASQDPRSRFFTSLGFEVPAELDEVADGAFFGTLSPERADLIDADLLVWDQMQYVDGGRATIESDPILGQLTAMEEGRAIFLEGDIENGFAFNTVLSLPFVLDGVLPQLEAAVEDSSGS